MEERARREQEQRVQPRSHHGPRTRTAGLRLTLEAHREGWRLTVWWPRLPAVGAPASRQPRALPQARAGRASSWWWLFNHRYKDTGSTATHGVARSPPALTASALTVAGPAMAQIEVTESTGGTGWLDVRGLTPHTNQVNPVHPSNKPQVKRHNPFGHP